MNLKVDFSKAKCLEWEGEFFFVYLLKNHGKLVIITPQEAGFKSDATHVEFMNFAKLKAIARELDSKIIKQYSFPFPRIVGKLFKYNEFVSLSQKEK